MRSLVLLIAFCFVFSFSSAAFANGGENKFTVNKEYQISETQKVVMTVHYGNEDYSDIMDNAVYFLLECYEKGDDKSDKKKRRFRLRIDIDKLDWRLGIIEYNESALEDMSASLFSYHTGWELPDSAVVFGKDQVVVISHEARVAIGKYAEKYCLDHKIPWSGGYPDGALEHTPVPPVAKLIQDNARSLADWVKKAIKDESLRQQPPDTLKQAVLNSFMEFWKQ